MKRCLVAACLIILTLSNLYANIAKPVQPPDPAGDILGAVGIDALLIEKEELFLDLTGTNDPASRARYFIKNPLGETLATDLWFVTPFMQKVSVTVNGNGVPLVWEILDRAKIFWAQNYDRLEGFPKEMSAYRFRAEFNPGAVTIIEVTFKLPAGYDNRNADIGMYPSQAAHLLNWGKGGDHVAWYLYNLDAANSFKGAIGELAVEITALQEAELQINITLSKGPGENGVTKYKGSFSGMPVPWIEAKVVTRAVYNIIGGTFALGLSTNYDDYTEFMTQALFDIYFFNHQFSAGVEGNPFGTGFKIPVLYAFFPGGRTSSYEGMWGDLRFGAGGLFDLLPQTRVGFRIAAGLRFLVNVIEITYDFYPFDATSGYVWRMGFLYKVSI